MVQVHPHGSCTQSTLPPIANNIQRDKTDLFCHDWNEVNKCNQIQLFPQLTSESIPDRVGDHEFYKEAQFKIRQETTLNAKRKSNLTRKHTKTQGKTWNSTPARNKARARWKLCPSPWIISALKDFFDERNKLYSVLYCLWTVLKRQAEKVYNKS